MFLSKSLRFVWITCEKNLSSVKSLFCKRPCTTQVSVKDKEILKKFNRPKSKLQKFRIDEAGWALLVIPVTAFGLGTWQIQRKFEKNKMIENLNQRTNMEPVNIPTDLSLLDDMEYRPVRVKGRFDHSKEIFIGPRPVIKDNKAEAQESTLISSQKGGFLVITPFKLSDRDLTILVNRGWVSSAEKPQKNRMKGQITDEVEIVGLIRKTERRKPLGLDNEPEKGIWIYKDIESMSEMTGTAPVLIDAVKASSQPGGPIGGQYVVKLPDDHLSYIATWYGLCGFTSYMWYMKYIKKVWLI